MCASYIMEKSVLSRWQTVFTPPDASSPSSGQVSPRRALFWVVAKTGMFKTWPTLCQLGPMSDSFAFWSHDIGTHTGLEQLLRSCDHLRKLMDGGPKLFLQVADAVCDEQSNWQLGGGWHTRGRGSLLSKCEPPSHENAAQLTNALLCHCG